jgi:AcrR family transcriptional regulator
MTSQNGSRVPDRDVAPPGRDRNAAGQDAPGPEGQAAGPERRPRGREGQERDRQRQALDRRDQQRDLERQAQDRRDQQRDRLRQERDRQRQERGRRGGTPDSDVRGFAGSPAGPPMESGSEDELWAPLLGPFDRQGPDRGSRAHQRLREHADREPRGRGRNRLAPTLSRGEIVDAAIAIADAEGPEAISMRRIAQVLKAGTMSLYWHVTNKEQLLDLMLDALLADIKVPEPSGDWRTDLQTLARNERTTLLRHNWIMGFLGGRPAMGPNTLLHLDRSLALLDGLDLDFAAAVDILGLIQTYVMGAVLREMREQRIQRDQEQHPIAPEDWEPARQAWRDRLAADGRFSRVVKFLDEGIDPDAEETRDQRFEFGLDCVLDGISARVPPKSPGA